MKHFEFKSKSEDGLTLYFQGWEPDRRKKGVICLVHGIGEHSGRYEHLAERLVKDHFALISFDLRGHGNSEGQKGYIPSYNAVMKDISLLIKEAKKRYPGLSLFLYGHSLGGSLVLYYILTNENGLKGVIATDPDLGLAFEPPKWKKFMARALNRIYPSLSMATGLNTDHLCKNPEVVRKYLNDPLVHDRITPRLFVEMQDAAKWVVKHGADVNIPVLVMHGARDHITSSEKSREFADKVKKELSTYKLWQGCFHEIHNEPEKNEVFNYTIKWIKAHNKR
ncbi:MAG: lysophospholipase [Spirochaetes bacterium]|nr:lysophospholipase [Spirochaetota bacterium]